MDFVIGNVLTKGVKVKFGQNHKGDPTRDLQEESKVKHSLMGPESPSSQDLNLNHQHTRGLALKFCKK